MNNNKILFLQICLIYTVLLQSQTTIVYNVSTNSCSGTNMNCEGFVNSVGDLVVWDTNNSQLVKHSTFTESKTITLDFKNSKSSKIVHTFTPSTGTSKGKRIRVLFCLIPFNKQAELNLPEKVASEVKEIMNENVNNSINSIIKIYRQFTSDNNPPAVSEWTEVATLLLPKTTAPAKQTVSLHPDGIAVAKAKNESGEEVDLVIDLQKEY